MAHLIPFPIPYMFLVYNLWLYGEKQEGLVSETKRLCVTMMRRPAVKGHFEKPAFVGHAATLQVYFLTLYSLKLSCYNHLTVSKAKLKHGSTLNFTDLWLTHVHFHPSTTLHTDKIGHVASGTRPSCFSRVILRSWKGLGPRLALMHMSSCSTLISK